MKYRTKLSALAIAAGVANIAPSTALADGARTCSGRACPPPPVCSITSNVTFLDAPMPPKTAAAMQADGSYVCRYFYPDTNCASAPSPVGFTNPCPGYPPGIDYLGSTTCAAYIVSCGVLK